MAWVDDTARAFPYKQAKLQTAADHVSNLIAAPCSPARLWDRSCFQLEVVEVGYEIQAVTWTNKEGMAQAEVRLKMARRGRGVMSTSGSPQRPELTNEGGREGGQ